MVLNRMNKAFSLQIYFVKLFIHQMFLSINQSYQLQFANAALHGELPKQAEI